MARQNPMRAAVIKMHKANIVSSKIAKDLGITRMTVWRTIKRWEEVGGLSDRKRKGRPRSVRTSKLVDAVRKRISRNATRSISKMAKDMGISRRTMERVIRKDLWMSSYHTRKAAILTDPNRLARIKKCRALLRRTRNNGHRNIVFSDEKLFPLQQVFNPQNVRVIARSAEEADKKGRVVNRVAHPAQIMVWAGVCATGKTPLVFVDPGVKINKEYYKRHILEKSLLPWSQSHFGNDFWIFQQDSAPAHKAKVVQEWCKQKLPDFISTSDWPSSSPDLNPLDYSVWSYLESKACARPHPNLQSLKEALLEEWDKIDESYLRPVIDAFPKRLRAVIRAEGGRIEK